MCLRVRVGTAVALNPDTVTARVASQCNHRGAMSLSRVQKIDELRSETAHET
jgi:hypothetical protein